MSCPTKWLFTSQICNIMWPRNVSADSGESARDNIGKDEEWRAKPGTSRTPQSPRFGIGMVRDGIIRGLNLNSEPSTNFWASFCRSSAPSRHPPPSPPFLSSSTHTQWPPPKSPRLPNPPRRASSGRAHCTIWGLCRIYSHAYPHIAKVVRSCILSLMPAFPVFYCS